MVENINLVVTGGTVRNLIPKDQKMLLTGR